MPILRHTLRNAQRGDKDVVDAQGSLPIVVCCHLDGNGVARSRRPAGEGSRRGGPTQRAPRPAENVEDSYLDRPGDIVVVARRERVVDDEPVLDSSRAVEGYWSVLL